MCCLDSAAIPPQILKRASALAQKALALENSSGMALELVSDIDRVTGRFDEAVKIAERVAIADPDNSFSYWFLAQALDGDGRPDEAALAICKAIRVDPALKDFGDSCAAICCACSSVPPLLRYVVMPVARNVWQHVE